MALMIDELHPLKLYSGNYFYNIQKEDRKKGSLVYLMTPNKQSSINVINHKLGKRNNILFQSYFLDRNIDFVINGNLSESKTYNINDEEVIPEIGITESLMIDNRNEISLTENALIYNGEDYKERILFPDDVDEILSEASQYKTKYGSYNLTAIFKNMLYKHRLKTNKDVLKIYEEIKKSCDLIKFTYVDPRLYKGRNLFYDWSYYTEIFFKENSKFQQERGLDVFFSFMDKFITDRRFPDYSIKTIVIPVNDWCKGLEDPYDFKKNINPISLFFRRFRMNFTQFGNWSNHNILFLGTNGFFTMKLDNFDPNKQLSRFKMCCDKLIREDYSDAEVVDTDSKTMMMSFIADKLAQGGIELDNISGATKHFSREEIKDMGTMNNPTLEKDKSIKKAILVQKLEKIVNQAKDTNEVLKRFEDNDDSEENEQLKELLLDIQSDDGVKMNQARTDRMQATRKELLKKQINGKSVADLMDQFSKNYDLKEAGVEIDSIDETWKHLKFPSFYSSYTKEDMEADIVAVFKHYTTVTHPMNILDINVENTSTAEDYVNTWTVKYEDAETGKRYTMVVDMPRLIDNRFMMLRGNEKVLISQFMLMPIIKTSEFECQMVSNYNKIFIRRKSPTGNGKSTVIINKLMRVLLKYDGTDFKVNTGDNRKVASRYELPIDFIDMTTTFDSIQFNDGSYISFNMKTLSEIPIDRTLLGNTKLTDEELNRKYMAIYVNKNGKRVPISEESCDHFILRTIQKYDKSGRFQELYDVSSVSKKLMYAEASILGIKIPVIVLLSYNIGLQKVLSRHNIEYEFTEKRPSKDQFYIKFSDGYLVYEPKSEADNLLINGLMQFDTSEYSISDINSKDMWISVLDEFGGRIKADGLDNFYDLFMDPITTEICRLTNLPTDYVGAMLYANDLLIDNKYNRHTDITGNRLRTNEIIVGHLYLVTSRAFGDYRKTIKKNPNLAQFTVKKSAVIDSILTHDQTSSDLSTLTPLLESESGGKVTFKGLSGMNSERAFSVDKRTYDKSMLGIVGISTGFATTVGVNRQLTIDANIRNKRGFVGNTEAKNLNSTNGFSMFEALSPMAINHDDPFRTAMAYTQTGQHQMTTRKSMPNLVTTGADQAIAYLTSNKFAYKFRGNRGIVKEINNDYMIIQDLDTKECEFVDLRETIRKNSDGGFYLTTKLTATEGLKKGSKLKQNEIVAYDRKNYSKSVGTTGDPHDISYNIGTLAKVAIMNTDMAFEDSCVVDEYVSDALTTNLCYMKDINLNKLSNVYNLVKPGDKVEADDSLLVFQDSFDEEEANELLRNISMDQEFISDIGRKHIRSKTSGVVQDVKIYRTCEISELSPTLQKICKEHDARINKLKKAMRDNKIEREYTLEPTKKLEASGKLKGLEGVRIEIYVKAVDKFGIGDKLVFYQALKGVCSYTIPKEVSGYTDYRPNEKVGAYLSQIGTFKRMVPSCYLLGFTNKLLVELTRQCQEELGIKWRPIQEIMEDEPEE